MSVFGWGFSLLLVSAITTVVFFYTWFRSHGVTNATNVRVDAMAGDEGEDW